MRGNFVTDRNGSLNPNYKHRLKNTRLFSIWSNIKSRCLNKNSTNYHRYGGRSIKICNEWIHDFKSFYEWSINHGYSDNLTIDRIDNNGNYTPDNCRWVDSKVQSTNKSNNHYVIINGIKKTLSEWCILKNINYRTVQDRLKRKWSIERALSEKVQTKFRRK